MSNKDKTKDENNKPKKNDKPKLEPKNINTTIKSTSGIEDTKN